jgi:hypothetical protein
MSWALRRRRQRELATEKKPQSKRERANKKLSASTRGLIKSFPLINFSEELPAKLSGLLVPAPDFSDADTRDSIDQLRYDHPVQIQTELDSRMEKPRFRIEFKEILDDSFVQKELAGARMVITGPGGEYMREDVAVPAGVEERGRVSK